MGEHITYGYTGKKKCILVKRNVCYKLGQATVKRDLWIYLISRFLICLIFDLNILDYFVMWLVKVNGTQDLVVAQHCHGCG